MFKQTMRLLRRNAKMEIVCYVAGCILVADSIFVRERHLQMLFATLRCFLTHERISDVSSFFAIAIGIYIAIITIIATSIIGISRKLLEQNRHKDLLCVISFGMIQNLLAVVIGVFLSGQVDWLNRAYITIVVAGLISFVKFIYLIILIFSANMKQMTMEIDEGDRFRDAIESTLKQIENNTKK